MASITKDGFLNVKGKKHQIVDLIQDLSFVSGTYIVSFLQGIGLSVPRKLRMAVLKRVLKDVVDKTIEERKTLADEMGYRLTWFQKYTDSQLVNLLDWYKSTSLNNKYLMDFWSALLAYMVESGVSDQELEKLFGHATLEAKKQSRPQARLFNDEINAVLYDNPGEIDGVTQEQFRPVTYKATTLSELRAIGDKYNAPIPKRLKKKEVFDVIIDKLKEKNELTPQLEEKLKGQNIILLERFAKDHDIKVSTELKKEEIIEFILSNAQETRASYFVPQSLDVYETIDEEPKEEIKEPIVPPVIETKIEPQVKEETPVEPVKTPEVVSEKIIEKQVVVSSGIDYKPELNRLAEAFEKLAQAFSEKEFTIKVDNHIESVERPVVAEKQVEEKEERRPLNTNLMVNPEVIVKELLKDDESDIPSFEETEEKVVEKAVLSTGYRKFILVLAGFISLIFAAAFTTVALAVNQIIQLPAEIDLSIIPLDSLMTMIIASVLAAINLVAFIRFVFMKPTKKGIITWAIILLITGSLIAGFIAFFGIKKVYVLPKEEPKDDAGRIIEAIQSMQTEKPQQKRYKMNVLLKIFLILFITAAIIFAGLYAMWRLGITYGYENIPFIGPFLRDSVIIPLFGSAHEMAS
ncbi:Uncharacterised protein [Acholeplasma oculi]|uniref:Uncharacterized protein n=1 Tax=Acholeplasma oculi TaxID=35623 RepID=A0A061AB48_9MOLU|nr:hypothetical protein [Acholeplasma oculi]CDR31078.1 hypothetical protein Aocu_10050 [Acholeplasma oculi]SKC36856.1 hypothetical protein SAMN02745122_0436 [Acholeplasma oculi]SUT90712.1 Uncharacterised protein [Acholeplasma oculi]